LNIGEESLPPALRDSPSDDLNQGLLLLRGQLIDGVKHFAKQHWFRHGINPYE